MWECVKEERKKSFSESECMFFNSHVECVSPECAMGTESKKVQKEIAV
jgi:hypothetical protein